MQINRRMLNKLKFDETVTGIIKSNLISTLKKIDTKTIRISTNKYRIKCLIGCFCIVIKIMNYEL